jgi:V-type H+-transporting ATPase subunit H
MSVDNMISPVATAFPNIQWDALGSLRLTAQETALLRMAETNPIDYTLADSRDASMYARVLLKLLAEAASAGAGSGEVSTYVDKCTDEQAMHALDVDPLGVVTHYALTKLNEIISTLSKGDSGVTVASVFYVGKGGLLVDQWKALLRILNKGGKGDVFAQKSASMSLGQILIASCPSKGSSDSKSRPISYASAIEPMEALVAWIVSQLKNATGSLVGLCIPALVVLMDSYESRVIFAKAGGIKYLARQLLSGSKQSSPSDGQQKFGQGSVQQLYALTFCMWILTYELNTSWTIRADFAKEGVPVQAVCELVAAAPREKVIRVALAALNNLATCVATEDAAPAGSTTHDGKLFSSEMVGNGLMKSIVLLRDRQFTDPDIVEDIDSVYKLLVENYKEMSRWEVYKNEVEKGHLQWGSVHTEAFFKENAKMFEGPDGDFSILKVLITLLSSKDEEVVAIACYDIGEFVRFYPNGRSITKRLGAKELVMPLIESENVDLQRHALQCVSKIMVQNWEYVK